MYVNEGSVCLSDLQVCFGCAKKSTVSLPQVFRFLVVSSSITDAGLDSWVPWIIRATYKVNRTMRRFGIQDWVRKTLQGFKMPK